MLTPSVLASHLGGLFHHKPALVAPLFLWVGYFLCAHHTHSSFSNFCTYMHTHSSQPIPHPGSMPTCTPFHAPLCTLHAIFSWVFLTPTPLPVPWHTSISIPWPMGREILLSGQDSNLSGAPANLSMLSAIHSKSQGHAIWSRLSQGLVGWVRVLGELWMCVG